ncbi:HET-domain-containing protein [Hypoxylon sp. FL0543]|nr:HET-domain-containing protein [Hypoxylon sp. FL0543]
MATCELCHALVVNPEDSARLFLEFTPAELRRSALDSKCLSCTVLFKGILIMQDDTWSFETNVSRVYGYGYLTGTETLTLEVYFSDGRPRLMLEFFTLSERHIDPIPWNSIKPRTRTNGHPLSQEALQWVKSRLEICFKHHVCSEWMDKPLPVRVLTFERSCGGEISVKLVLKRSESGRYAVLSHCWGSHLSCTTRNDNLSERMQGIPWTELPQTFQDAICYCLELGIRYLWIDALCILQDDQNDWQIESSRMADTYQNSYISLAATSSDRGTSGCFQKQPTAPTERSFAARSATGGVHQILIRHQLPHWSATPNELSARNNPLLSRGWVFQERVLAPRILHFCKQELVWECGELTCCECGGVLESQNMKMQFALATRLKSEGELADSEYENAQERFDQWRREIRLDDIRARHATSRELSWGNNSDSDDNNRAGLLVDLGYPQLKELFELSLKSALDLAINQWHQIVEQYSPLVLTKDMDRLPALSGLAERMAPFLGKYYAGLWDKSFLRDLTWRVDQLSPGLRRPTKYRGPSWSWVSVNTGVSFWTEAEMTPFSVLRRFAASLSRSGIYAPSPEPVRDNAAPDIMYCQVKAEDSNPYGEVLSAVLVIEGVLRSAQVGKITNADGFPVMPPSFEVEVDKLSQDNGLAPSLRLSFFADYVLEVRRLPKGSVFLFMLSSEVGLVLHKTPMAMRDVSVYQRIGILRVPYLLMGSYGIDLVKGSTRTRIAII